MPPDDHDDNFKSSDNVVVLPSKQAEEAAADQGNETQKDALIRLGSEAKLWHDPDQQSFASFSIKGHTENHPLRSKPFKSWIRWQYYKETEKAPGSQALEDALCILEAKAVFDGKEKKTFLRIAGAEGLVYIDLGDESWCAIEHLLCFHMRGK